MDICDAYHGHSRETRADASGLTPELDGAGKATVIPATLDPSQFTGISCIGSLYLTSAALMALANGSAKVNLLDPSVTPTPTAITAGRYAVLVSSFARQVWRVPNELQPSLLDPHVPPPGATMSPCFRPSRPR